MYIRTTTNEQTYTLTQARKIIRKEQLRKREVFIIKAIQKCLGIVAIIISVAEFILANNGKIDEGGAFIIALPVGLCLLFSKKQIIF